MPIEPSASPPVDDAQAAVLAQFAAALTLITAVSALIDAHARRLNVAVILDSSEAGTAA